MCSNIDNTLRSFERVLNGFGYFPIVSSFSAPVRFVYGKVELISGLGLAAISACANNSQEIVHGLELGAHGIANMARACVEVVPVINMSCILYDLVDRFEYQSLQNRVIHHHHVVHCHCK